ncbi:YncE family protein [Flavobacterium sp. 7A]|uniref:YncE family protein n=1 Tax=Flavobacterium sp. 7A TaxID=2940571 RepID=UPI002227DEAB|nr:DUF5074 domain-containing protein [Flavobacterium sp. 7A]MCW2119588.1 YVTN family beta-propeller protein [Flavobacterium sp. 7A]
MNFKKITIACVSSALTMISCTNDDAAEQSLGSYNKGVIVVNEGVFNKGNAEISFLSNDTNMVSNQLFATNNGGNLLGDVAQNFNVNGSTAYVVLNGSNTIQVLNRYTLKTLTTITTDLINPRYITFANGKGYVTNWGDGYVTTDDYVAVINLTTNVVEAKIPVAEGPENIIAYNNKLYVAHKGGYGTGNTVSVIDVATAKVSTTITVGDSPSAIEEDQGVIYVLSQGKLAWTKQESAGKLQKINPVTNTVTSTFDFELASHPGKMDIESNKIYYTQGKDIFVMNTTATVLPSTSIFSSTFSPYGFAVNGTNIYLGDAGDYASNGKIAVYSTNGTLNFEKTVGISPNGFFFNN